MIFSFGRFHSRDVPLVDICLHDMTILFLSIALFSTYHSNIPTRKRVLIPSPLNFVNIDIASVFDILPHACLTAQNLLPVTFQNLLILKSAFTYTSQGLNRKKSSSSVIKRNRFPSSLASANLGAVALPVSSSLGPNGPTVIDITGCIMCQLCHVEV